MSNMALVPYTPREIELSRTRNAAEGEQTSSSIVIRDNRRNASKSLILSHPEKKQQKQKQRQYYQPHTSSRDISNSYDEFMHGEDNYLLSSSRPQQMLMRGPSPNVSADDRLPASRQVYPVVVDDPPQLLRRRHRHPIGIGYATTMKVRNMRDPRARADVMKKKMKKTLDRLENDAIMDNDAVDDNEGTIQQPFDTLTSGGGGYEPTSAGGYDSSSFPRRRPYYSEYPSLDMQKGWDKSTKLYYPFGLSANRNKSTLHQGHLTQILQPLIDRAHPFRVNHRLMDTYVSLGGIINQTNDNR